MEAPKKVLVRTDLGKNSTHVINTVKKKNQIFWPLDVHS